MFLGLRREQGLALFVAAAHLGSEPPGCLLQGKD